MTKLIPLLLLLATPALAFPPVNAPIDIQPTEIKDWACDFGVPVTTLIDYDAILRSGVDATCDTPLGDADNPWGYECDPVGLITEPTVSGTLATFRVTPTGKASGNVYQVKITVADSGGQRFTCDGKVTVRVLRVVN